VEGEILPTIGLELARAFAAQDQWRAATTTGRALGNAAFLPVGCATLQGDIT
jgi:hypothetical protein